MQPQIKDEKWIVKNDSIVENYRSMDLFKKGTYLLIGDSHIARLFSNRYCANVWKEMFGPSSVNLGVGGDSIENVLWRIDRYNLPGNCDVVVVHVGGNNIRRTRKAKDIAHGIKQVALALHKNNKNALVFLTGILPGRGKHISIVCKVNNVLGDITRDCNKKNIFYMKPVFENWMNEYKSIKRELSCGDDLHLNVEGYKLFVRYISEICQQSEDFHKTYEIPYKVPITDTTVRYGIGEP